MTFALGPILPLRNTGHPETRAHEPGHRFLPVTSTRLLVPIRCSAVNVAGGGDEITIHWRCTLCCPGRGSRKQGASADVSTIA